MVTHSSVSKPLKRSADTTCICGLKFLLVHIVSVCSGISNPPCQNVSGISQIDRLPNVRRNSVLAPGCKLDMTLYFTYAGVNINASGSSKCFTFNAVSLGDQAWRVVRILRSCDDKWMLVSLFM